MNTLYKPGTGPLIRYLGGMLLVDALNPQTSIKWRMSRWEMIATALEAAERALAFYQREWVVEPAGKTADGIEMDEYGHPTIELADDHGAQAREALALVKAALAEDEVERPPLGCTCSPDDDPPRPCPQKFALSACEHSARIATEARVKELEGATETPDERQRKIVAWLRRSWLIADHPRPHEIADRIEANDHMKEGG